MSVESEVVFIPGQVVDRRDGAVFVALDDGFAGIHVWVDEKKAKNPTSDADKDWAKAMKKAGLPRNTRSRVFRNLARATHGR